MLHKKKTPSIQGQFPVFPFLCLVGYELGSGVGSRRKSPIPGLCPRGRIGGQRLGRYKEYDTFLNQKGCTLPSPCSGAGKTHPLRFGQKPNTVCNHLVNLVVPRKKLLSQLEIPLSPH